MARFVALILLMLPAIVNAQNVIVSGNVKSSAGGDALGSVSVTMKGSSIGTFTDNKGNFRLSLPSNTK
ncbi:MAG: CarboxypepD reg-like domain, partial [Bacteroidota bacterium]